MKPIITMFKRGDQSERQVVDEVADGAEWVINGEGIATRKYEGLGCMVLDGRLYRRHSYKIGEKVADGFEPSQGPNQVTGRQQGWLLVGGGPGDKWHRRVDSTSLKNGTYELCGPHVEGNREKYAKHVLVSHEAAEAYPDFPRTYDAIREALKSMGIEGVVWHHPDGRMAKIKATDFGFKERACGNKKSQDTVFMKLKAKSKRLPSVQVDFKSLEEANDVKFVLLEQQARIKEQLRGRAASNPDDDRPSAEYLEWKIRATGALRGIRSRIRWVNHWKLTKKEQTSTVGCAERLQACEMAIDLFANYQAKGMSDKDARSSTLEHISGQVRGLSDAEAEVTE